MDDNVWKDQLAWSEYGILGIYGRDRLDCHFDECIFLEFKASKFIE